MVLAALVSSSLGTGCKCGTEPQPNRPSGLPVPSASATPGASPSKEVLLWDFSTPPESTLLSLWPPDTAAPRPKSSGIQTTNEQGTAVVVVDGTNPHAEWAFSPPLRAKLLSLELDSAKVGKLEVSWRSKDCPATVDACTASEALGVGRQTAEFALPVSEINAIRVRFPEENGTRLVIHRMRMLANPRATGAWRAGDNADVAEGVSGFKITGRGPNPNVSFSASGLEAALVDTIELDVARGEFTPKVYWHGSECAHFMEECAVPFTPGQPATHFKAVVAGHPHWKGRVNGFRLDPGGPPGEYVVGRFALLRAAPPGGSSAP